MNTIERIQNPIEAEIDYKSRVEALREYQGTIYEMVNNYLRRSKTINPWFERTYTQIMELSATQRTTDEVVFARGSSANFIRKNPRELYKIGDILTDEGFVSMSDLPEPSSEYSSREAIYRIKVPKNFPIINVSGTLGEETLLCPWEREFILPAGTSFLVENIVSYPNKRFNSGLSFVIELLALRSIISI
jgi:ADP-ribosyltransferase exoenzyme